MRTAGQGPGGFEKRDGFMIPGQDLVMAGFTGFEGTRRIGQCKREELEAHFSPMFLRCLDQTEDISVKQWMEYVYHYILPFRLFPEWNTCSP